jgi:hypothetical protein
MGYNIRGYINPLGIGYHFVRGTFFTHLVIKSWEQTISSAKNYRGCGVSVWTNKGFFGFVIGYHVASFMDGNKSDISSGCIIPTDSPHCTRDFPSRFDRPRKSRSLGVLLEKNAGKPLEPS